MGRTCQTCKGYYCNNEGGCPVTEVKLAQPVLNCYGGTLPIPAKKATPGDERYRYSMRIEPLKYETYWRNYIWGIDGV